MSETAAPIVDDQQAFLVKLRRDLVETQKLGAERDKLYQEALKLNRDRVLAPVVAVGGVAVGLLGCATAILALILHAR